jgi:serine/threonine protein kinase
MDGRYLGWPHTTRQHARQWKKAACSAKSAISDLYALGVTLYQMLTSALPFTATDPMEWVHCHIARKPMAPSERQATVPAAVSYSLVFAR